MHIACAGTAPLAIALRGMVIRRFDRKEGSGFTLDVPEFTLGQRERVGIVGQSGSGKTTLLQLLGLLSWPDQIESFRLSLDQTGALYEIGPILQRRDATRLADLRAACIGFVMQDGGLLPYLSIRENAWLAAQLAGRATDRTRRRIDELAGLIGIGDFLDRKQAALSGGQRQRAAVLRALASGPPFLFADEPTSGLDEDTAELVMSALTESAAAAGTTIIVVSHDLALLRRHGFALRRIVTEKEGSMRYGRLLAQEDGTP